METEAEWSPNTIDIEVRTKMDLSTVADRLEEISQAYQEAADHLRDNE